MIPINLTILFQIYKVLNNRTLRTKKTH